jgi:hypothetical protein
MDDQNRLLAMRVFQINQPFTLAGLTPWQFMMLVFTFAILQQTLEGRFHDAIVLGASVAGSLLSMFIVNIIQDNFPGKAFPHFLSWLSTADHYKLTADTNPVPLEIIPRPTKKLKNQKTTKPVAKQGWVINEE